MNFVAIDVETANSDMASICSIGAARFENDKVTSEWYSLVDPQDYFDDLNVSIHGIDEDTVRGAPTYAEIFQILDEFLSGAVVVTHTHFDRVAIHQASSRWAVAKPSCTWLDSARVARRTWVACASSGYGLANVCSLIGYQFRHHHALEDAKAAGYIMLVAMQKTGLDIDGWLHRVEQPIFGAEHNSTERDGNPDGPLFGEVIVFTGALVITRREAADLAARIGCEVDSGVTKKTTLLVVGDLDIQRLAGHQKSAKHRKAEELIADGRPIRILRESDFQQLVALA